MRIMALDVGERRIGVALSDPEAIIASGMGIVENRGRAAAATAVARLAQEHDAERIVVGLPLSLDGSRGPQAERVLDFCRALERATAVPIETWDERLSSVAAERSLLAAGLSRAERKARRDTLAAVIILQGYLERQRRR